MSSRQIATASHVADPSFISAAFKPTTSVTFIQKMPCQSNCNAVCSVIPNATGSNVRFPPIADIRATNTLSYSPLIYDPSWWMSRSAPASEPKQIRHDACPEPGRRRWTAPASDLIPLGACRLHNVAQAAAAAGMSRESAYRLRRRPEGLLFAALWDAILRPAAAGERESHTSAIAGGSLLRLLGMHFRRKTAGFFRPSGESRGSAAQHRTGTL